MNDDELRDALERRSAGAQFRAEELLPEVRRAVGVRPQPARVARWAPLAGLAAAAVIVVALVIAFPGGAPSPGSKSLDVMTTDAFASALQRGSLANETILVNGGIVPFDASIAGGPCIPPSPCALGQLENVQPSIAVIADQVAVAPSGSSSATQDVGWPSWANLSLPIRGTLVLSVDRAGGVKYLGRVVPNGDQLTWSVGQVKTELDVTAQDLGDVVLVNGWLTGVDFPAPCQTFPPQFPGLPDRSECGVDSWIADEPAVLTAQSEQPLSAIEVQPDAFAYYAPDPTARSGDSLRPQRAVYAVARRLYGQFCVTESPCWDWSVVGRLSQAGPNVAPPSVDAEQTPAVEATASAVPLQSGNELSCGNDMTVLDMTGLVASCSSNVALVPSQPAGLIATPTVITAMWTGAMCQPITQAAFNETGSGYELAISPSSPPYPSGAPLCAGGPLAMTLTLTLRTPVSAAITATFGGQDLPYLASPSPSPSTAAGALEQTCGPTMVLADSTGQVVNCIDGGGGDYHSAQFGVALDTDPHLVHLTWLANCERSEHISVANSAASGGVPRYQITIVPRSFDASCFFSPAARHAVIAFAKPVDPTAVSLDVESAVVDCNRVGDFGKHIDEVSIRDGTGLITACTQSPPSETDTHSDSAQDVQPNQIRVDWTDDEGPYLTLTFDQTDQSYELASPDFCSSCPNIRFEIVITFASHVDASSLWIGLEGRTLVPGLTPVATDSPMPDFTFGTLPPLQGP